MAKITYTDDLEKAELAGLDTTVERRRLQLQKDNPKMSHADALDRATRDVQKAGYSAYGGTVQCRLTTDLMKRVNLYRAKSGMSFSDVVRAALHKFVP